MSALREDSLGRYLKSVYGEWVYTENPALNFINVHRGPRGLVMSQAVFYERFPKEPKIGTVIPKSLLCPVRRNETGGAAPLLKRLAERGYVALRLPCPARDLATLSRSRFTGENAVGEPTAAFYGSFDRPGVRRRRLMRWAQTRTARMAAALQPRGNALFAAAAQQPFNVLNYGLGSGQTPHCDVHFGTFCIMLLYFTGVHAPERRLQVGTYDFENAFKAILSGAADWNSVTETIGARMHPRGIADLASGHGRMVVLNNFNPRFYHAVTPAQRDQRVFALSCHLGSRRLRPLRARGW